MHTPHSGPALSDCVPHSPGQTLTNTIFVVGSRGWLQWPTPEVKLTTWSKTTMSSSISSSGGQAEPGSWFRTFIYILQQHLSFNEVLIRPSSKVSIPKLYLSVCSSPFAPPPPSPPNIRYTTCHENRITSLIVPSFTSGQNQCRNFVFFDLRPKTHTAKTYTQNTRLFIYRRRAILSVGRRWGRRRHHHKPLYSGSGSVRCLDAIMAF